MKFNKNWWAVLLLAGTFIFTRNVAYADENSQSSSQSSADSSVVSSQTDSQSSSEATSDSSTNSSAASSSASVSQAKTGWQVIGKKHYYYQNGAKLKGLRKIGKYWYLFNKNGVMQTGFHKRPNGKTYNYFDNAGRKRFTNTNTAKAYYWIKKSTGTIVGIRNYSAPICQRPQLPTGCEITAVTMMINFAGYNISKIKAANLMPLSYNPNRGFVGSPYSTSGTWVAPGGVAPVVKRYLGTYKIMTGCSLSAIKNKLINSHLVVVWVSNFDGFPNHALTLTGYHNSTLYYNDPWTGTRRHMSARTFYRHWNAYWQGGHQRAISY